MRPQKVLNHEVFTALTKVFRAKGFEGASLNEIARQTGLKKASLYHRFPDGKKQMAETVFDHIDEWVENNIFKAISDNDLSPKQRLNLGLEKIRILYNGGNEACIFRTMSMQVGIELFGNRIQNGMNQWISHFKDLALAFGHNKAKSQMIALNNLIDIQGSLIVAEGLQDVDVFEKTLKRIRNRYIRN